MVSRSRWAAFVGAIACCAGCHLILGFDQDYREASASAGGAASASGATGGSTVVSGTGGAGECAEGDTQPCGNCGTQTCARGAWGACSGEGPCKPGDTDPCGGGCSARLCSDACTWCDCPTAQCANCDGTAGEWLGCRGNGCFVCAEKLDGYPCYLTNHPGCSPNYGCDGGYYTCNSKCPMPTAADACACVPSASGWAGCKGTGCGVCKELTADYACYFVHHPACEPDAACNGSYAACDETHCPPPSAADVGSMQ